ncbi:MAG: nucleotidyltransferase family protein [Trueperaceae bacterium]|nr:nucleotidyltransferase family protein [Trueperaceae bacterium]
MITGIILAGGESQRMGKAKLALEYQGKSLLEHAIGKAKPLCDEVLVVVGAYHDTYKPLVEKGQASLIYNADWQEGLGSSLRTGLLRVPEQTELALVLLGDQPFIPETHLQDLLKTQQDYRADLVFSSYEGIQGPPVVIAKELFNHASELKGDKGAKTLKREGTRVAELELEHYQDIDTPEDVRRFLEGYTKMLE